MTSLHCHRLLNRCFFIRFYPPFLLVNAPSPLPLPVLVYSRYIRPDYIYIVALTRPL